VFGPILFVVLLVVAVRAYRRGLPSPDRFLLAFALPIIVIITVQALVSRAHANWAAVSYVAATVLVTATMIRDGAWRWLTGSLALHVVVAVGIGVALTQARTLSIANIKNPFARTLGWKELAQQTRERLILAAQAGRPYRSVLVVDRSVAAELIYYMRDVPVPVLAWRGHGRPRDHYQLTRAFARPGEGALRGAEPALLVAIRRVPKNVLERFASGGAVEAVSVPTGAHAQRKVYFVRLAGFRGLGASQSNAKPKGR
jgi:hypothetical protein